MKSFNTPPFAITARILELVASVSEKTGAINTLFLNKTPDELRKINQIHTIHASLGLDGNSLSATQISDIINSNAVSADAKEIREAKNAIAVYDKLVQWHPFSFTSFCSAHRMMMAGLVENAGELRTGQVEITLYRKKINVAPDGKMVLPLMENLFSYVKTSRDLLLIKSMVFYYEMSFIHPFRFGNGRMGRLWQKVLLNEYNPVFESLAIEPLILEREQQFNEVLSRCKRNGKSTLFIEFMLGLIDEALQNLLLSRPPVISASDRLEAFRNGFALDTFTRKDYIQFFKNISTATASRDLQMATELEILNKTGDKNKTVYRFR